MVDETPSALRKVSFRSMSDGRRILVDEFIPVSPNGRRCLLLNSLFDEGDHCHQFLAACGERLSAIGIHTTQFDYYGTGDSGGESFEMDIHNNLEDIVEIGEKDILFGIRCGATHAIEAAGRMERVRKLVLIEPVTHGKNFVAELNLKASLVSHRPPVPFNYNGLAMHDFAGYPITDRCLQEMNSIEILDSNISEKEITLVKLRYVPSRSSFEELAKRLSQRNTVKIHYVDGDPVWPGYVDASPLLESISTFV